MLAQARDVVVPALVLHCSARLQPQSRPSKPPGLRIARTRRAWRETGSETGFKRADESALRVWPCVFGKLAAGGSAELCCRCMWNELVEHQPHFPPRTWTRTWTWSTVVWRARCCSVHVQNVVDVFTRPKTTRIITFIHSSSVTALCWSGSRLIPGTRRASIHPRWVFGCRNWCGGWINGGNFPILDVFVALLGENDPSKCLPKARKHVESFFFFLRASFPSVLFLLPLGSFRWKHLKKKWENFMFVLSWYSRFWSRYNDCPVLFLFFFFCFIIKVLFLPLHFTPHLF